MGLYGGAGCEAGYLRNGEAEKRGNGEAGNGETGKRGTGEPANRRTGDI